MYGDIFNEVPSGAVPNGIWADEVDPSVVYPDLQDFEDYQRNSYRPKPYDNLQSILNAEMYPEPVALPLQYPYRYYGDRKKRSNKKNNFDLRLKRESKLTPADMLALVALVEAGERSRQEAENEEALNEYQKSLLSPYGSQPEDTNDWLNSWQDQAYDYKGLPYNLHSQPRYDILEDQRLGSNYYPSKRYMVAKKKRSLGHFLNEPSVLIPSSSIAYDTRYLAPELVGKGSKIYQKYF